MATPKGWTSQQKDNRDEAFQFSTVEPIRALQHGLSVLAHQFVSEVGTDAVEAGSTTTVINATAHAAIKGDIINFTSGALSGQEVKVLKVTTNAIEVAEVLSVAPSAADTFQILRHKYPIVNTSGLLTTTAGPLLFTLNGSDQEVVEDTGTPANNAPLPVKLTGVTGDVNITAGDLNVQTSHTGASFDSMRIGDGTTLVGVTVSNEMQVADATARTSLGTLAGAVSGTEMQVDVLTSALPTGGSTSALQTTGNSSLSTIAGDTTSLDAKVPSQGAALTAASVPVNIASDQTVPVSAASLPLPTGGSTSALQTSGNASLTTIAGDTTSLDAKVPAQGAALTAASTPVNIASDQTVPVSAASLPLPSGAATSALQTTGNTSLSTLAGAVAGTEMQVDVVSSALPTGAATQATLATIAGAVSGTEMQVDVVASLPAGSATIGAVNVNRLDVVATTFTDMSSSNIPGNATNPLQLIASTGSAISRIQVADTGGAFYELMEGAAAAETRLLLIGPGSDNSIDIAISAATRVSIRRVDDAAALAVGMIAINYMG